ncbi:MAG: ankyrin repeat domain-containing protein [Planctomycetes bacterium]|nr:ankyrin repeat domain-containing protein [Planctomycetota bacterium]
MLPLRRFVPLGIVPALLLLAACNGRSALVKERYSGDCKEVIAAIRDGADVNAKGEWGLTPLHLAADWGRDEVAGMLIERGADVRARDAQGNTPLHRCAAPVAQEVRSWPKANLFADGAGQVKLIERLIRGGAEVNAQNGDGHTPLDVAAMSGALEHLRVLLANKADVRVVDAHGQTPLHRALYHGLRPEGVKLLIEAGADVNVRDGLGRPPLHQLFWGEQHWFAEDVAMLVKAGADAGARDNDGLTVLEFFEQSSSPERLASLREALEKAGVKSAR